jgi:hypothetical protein
MNGRIKLQGRFDFQCFEHIHEDGTKCLRHGKCGKKHIERLKWENEAKNAVVTEGLSHILDREFHGDAQVATWYIGLIKTAYTHDAADTLLTHAGWTEAVLTTDYTGNRKEWTEGAAAAGVMTNGVTVDFAMLTSITLKGALLCAAATGTAAALFCTAAFTGGDQAVNNGDTIKVTYTITASAA